MTRSDNIPDSAYLVALYRALETERSDALFCDRHARALAGTVGVALGEVLGSQTAISNAIAVRTRVIDELILQLVKTQKLDAILNLGAGLDTRPYRLPLPAALVWIEVDLPEVLTYKAQHLQQVQPYCEVQQIALDLSDASLRRSIFANLNLIFQRILVVTEGFLSYLAAEQVAELALDLQAQPHFHWWVTDLSAASAVQRFRSTAQANLDAYLTRGNPALQFTPASGAGFFQQYGWALVEQRSLWTEAQRLRRSPPFTWLLKLFSRWLVRERWATFKQKQSIILLKQTLGSQQN